MGNLQEVTMARAKVYNGDIYHLQISGGDLLIVKYQDIFHLCRNVIIIITMLVYILAVYNTWNMALFAEIKW